VTGMIAACAFGFWAVWVSMALITAPAVTILHGP
jgi:hypothetical protein